MTTGHDILLIDDDRRLADMVVRYLGQNGFGVQHRETGQAGLQYLAGQAPGLVLLDLMLPDADGLDLCRQIRQMPGRLASVPVLMLTARGDTMDRVVGLEVGADDYLPKPFEPRELLARVRALLRRATQLAPAPSPMIMSTPPAEVLVLDDLEIDVSAREVRVGGEARALTGYQFDLLLALARHAGRVLSRERLMDLVKGEQLEAFDRSIDVHVGKIRQAIEADPRQPKRLLTVRGVGYVLTRPRETVAAGGAEAASLCLAGPAVKPGG
ncbi:MAG: response regulator transcription factor [Lautropia sp.]|nr:response regulator transcription factor [Lautropia sp.]